MATPTRTRKKKAVKQDKPGTITVQTRVLVRQDGEESEDVVTDEFAEIEVEKFEVEPAYVSIKAGVTKSLRQFESLRVDVSAQIPCYVERMDEAFAYGADWVADKLIEEVDNYFNAEDGGDAQEED